MTKYDPIRNMITTAVQHCLLQGSEKPPLLPKPGDVISVSSKAVSPTVTQLIVELVGRKPRFFEVTVREHFQ